MAGHSYIFRRIYYNNWHMIKRPYPCDKKKTPWHQPYSETSGTFADSLENNVMPRPHRVKLWSHRKIIKSSRAVLPIKVCTRKYPISHIHRRVVRYKLSQRVQVPPRKPAQRVHVHCGFARRRRHNILLPFQLAHCEFWWLAYRVTAGSALCRRLCRRLPPEQAQ